MWDQGKRAMVDSAKIVCDSLRARREENQKKGGIRIRLQRDMYRGLKGRKIDKGVFNEKRFGCQASKESGGG